MGFEPKRRYKRDEKENTDLHSQIVTARDNIVPGM